ncbi:MAG: DUF4013 domain-containing protein, partial [Halobacteria archaeon]|nr:DUF4013 domain-containing protein [Halobacteria archaeon]
MLGEALKYPMNRDDWIKQLLIGGVMLIFGILLIPALIAYGYFVRVLESSIAGDEAPPVFDDWGDMIVDGLKFFVITLIYQIIPTIIFFVFVFGSLMALVSAGSEAAAGAALGGLFGGLAIWFIVSLIFAYFM